MNCRARIATAVLISSYFQLSNAETKKTAVTNPAQQSDHTQDQCRTLQPLSISLGKALSLTKEPPALVTAFSEDSRYGLPMLDFWSLQQDCLRRNGYSGMAINSQPLPSPMPLRAYLAAQKPGHAAAGAKWSLSAFNLAGELIIDRLPSFQIGLRVEVLDGRAQVIRVDTLPDLAGLTSHPGIAALFARLKSDSSLDQVEFHQRAVGKIETALFSSQKAPFFPGQSFSLQNLNHQIDKNQMDELRRVLTGHFGFGISNKSNQSIRLDPYGGLEFHRQGTRLVVDSLLDLQPLLDAKAWEPEKELTVVDTVMKSGPNWMPRVKRMRFSDASDRFPLLGMIVQREIDTVLPRAYGGKDGKLDTAYMLRVFKGGENSIQIGKWANAAKRPREGVPLSGPQAYSESVYYYRISPREYIDGLARKSAAGDRFDVQLNLLRLYREGLDGERYWGVVYQNWKTRDTRGRIKYKDDGLLLVNFDFKPDGKGKFRLEDFKIYYRFFFHRYHTSVFRKGPEGKQEEIKPSKRVMMDIAASFFKSAEIPPKVMFGMLNNGGFEPNPAARTLVGVNHGVLKVIHQDIEKVLP